MVALENLHNALSGLHRDCALLDDDLVRRREVGDHPCRRLDVLEVGGTTLDSKGHHDDGDNDANLKVMPSAPAVVPAIKPRQGNT